MEIAILIAAVLVAGLACPAMMWWQRRRGREAACCVPTPAAGRSELESLRERQRELGAKIAALDDAGRETAPTERRTS